ncbi:hypothetical protein L7F22_013343 [Adiantum nelumboides]|nr:hypothetical protein [Adiantum nelumboides]
MEKLQRQLLVSGFMSQTAQHEAKVKQLELELAQAKADLELQRQQGEVLRKGKEAMGSLASTSQIHQARTHLHIQLPLMPELPEFPGTQEEEQPRPAPGALDIREQIEQEIEDMPEGPAKEYLLYKNKVMELAALAFLQPKEQIKDFGHDSLPMPLMCHEAILWKEKMRSAVPQNEEGGYEGIPLTTEEAQTLIEDHPRDSFATGSLVQDLKLSSGFETVQIFVQVAVIGSGLVRLVSWTVIGSEPSTGTQGSATQDPHIAASDSSSDFDIMEGYPMQQHPESSSQDMHALGQQPRISMFSRLKETLSRATRSKHATNEINEGGGEVDSPFTSQIDPVLSESVHVSTPTTTPISLSKLTPSETLLPDGRSLAEVQEVERYILAAREKKIKSLRKGLNNVEQHWQKLL